MALLEQTDSRNDQTDLPQVTNPLCAVFAPITYLTVTVESEAERSSVHLHPGGQGFWIARMLTLLGCEARLVAPLGGEGGQVLAALLPGWGVGLSAVDIASPSPVQVQDRRSGKRIDVASLEHPLLDRHEVDELYGAVLEASLSCGAVVLTDAPEVIPDDFFTRLVADTATHDVPVFADAHGRCLEALLAGGSITALKISADDLEADGRSAGSEEQVIGHARELSRRGATTVVVSRADLPAIAVVDERVVRITPPQLSEVDHRGAGDSMTAGIVAGHLLGADPLEALRWGAAAGANNVTRRGLGSGRSELIAELASRVEIEEL